MVTLTLDRTELKAIRWALAVASRTDEVPGLDGAWSKVLEGLEADD